ncbi:hypothetical protein I553_3536 [Mycobacterium xenopi 4042]|uniref:Uncharacterized protein n=1 Tax=Mycobacterium xenopi 4042 TaxID=1299334 RepID=X8AKX1_MYCXE|nr:hypothetical protein I553_3536 [Mycobacterium xenopi 4042]
MFSFFGMIAFTAIKGITGNLTGQCLLRPSGCTQLRTQAATPSSSQCPSSPCC